MPGILSTVTNILTGGLVKDVTDIVGKFVQSPAEKVQASQELLQAIQQHEDAVDAARRDVIVAELKQDDRYTKRARPTVVYAGLVLLAINNMVLPWIATFAGMHQLPQINFPPEFWYGWSGIVATWAIGRSVEKVKSSQGTPLDSITKAITGAK